MPFLQTYSNNPEEAEMGQRGLEHQEPWTGWKGPTHAALFAIGAGLASLLLIGCLGDDDSPADAGLGSPTADAAEEPDALPTRPESERVDTEEPSFSNPTDVTNPLFPISDLHSVVLLGNVDGHLLRVETTFLPGTKIIDLDGTEVETLESQYVAFLDGRIEEVALDWYAQADDGAVWYLGEDVFNYEDGAVADTEGTWLAGRDGPAAMIMPADPQAGDVYRPENIPDIVFEEVTVMSIGDTVDGPQGSVEGAIVAEELHMDGSYEEKIFAPGYGEFSSGIGGDLEALAIAVPTDALSEPTPAELETLFSGAIAIFEAALADDTESVSATLDEMEAAWADFRDAGDVPELLAVQMDHALAALRGDAIFPAAEANNASGAAKAAIDVAMATLDLQLRHRLPAEIDLARFDLWTRQVIIDATGDEPSHIAGDVTVLEWIWDRFAHTVDDAAAADIEAHLEELRTAADDEDVEAAAEAAAGLRETLAELEE
ncbi:MAG: hypothetical protein WEB00_10725 [Dehalococcoidia bacterium]